MATTKRTAVEQTLVDGTVYEVGQDDDFKVGDAIHASTDYAKFTLIKGNRHVRMNKVENLVKSIEKQNLLRCFPIVVTSNYHIIDGQHRFVAAAKLKIPVWYVMVKGKIDLEVIALVNNQQNAWNMRDYLHMYQMLGLNPYKSFAGYIDNFGLSVTTGILLWLGKCNVSDQLAFKSGEFPGTGYNNAYETASALSDLQEYIPHCKMYKFCLAFVDILTHPDYNHKQMLKKLKITGTFPRCAQASDYIRELERVYNFKSREKVRFF